MGAEIKEFPKHVLTPAAERRDDIIERLMVISQELAVVSWAAGGLSYVIANGDHLEGIETMAIRLSNQVKKIAEEIGE